MKVITNTTLLIRRIGEVRRRREAIVDRQDRLRGSLPQWALAPLQLVGLTAAEIQGLMSDLSEAEKQAGLEDVERELEQLDQQIEELENLLLTTPSRSLDGIQAVLDMAVTRFRGQTVTDPERRLLRLWRRPHADLPRARLRRSPQPARGRAAPGELTAPAHPAARRPGGGPGALLLVTQPLAGRQRELDVQLLELPLADAAGRSQQQLLGPLLQREGGDLAHVGRVAPAASRSGPCPGRCRRAAARRSGVRGTCRRSFSSSTSRP